MIYPLDNLRFDREALLAELEAAGCQVKKPNEIRCCWHEDQHASAGVFMDEDGVIRYKCHGCGFGGDIYDIRAKARGISVEEALKEGKANRKAPQGPPPSAEKPKPRFPSVDAMRANIRDLAATYIYTSPTTGRVDMLVFRIEPPGDKKRFWQGHQNGDGFVLEAPPKPWPLYNRKRLATVTDVLVVEGEKCVHALHEVGIVATTSPGGALKAGYADWTPCAGKSCYLWPDNDPPDDKGERKGLRHMQEVAAILQRLSPPARALWIDPDELGLPAKGDAYDFLDAMQGSTAADKRLAVEAVCQDARPMGVSGRVLKVLEDIIAGKRRVIPWPWPVLSSIWRGLYAGSVTTICADAGATKSFAVLEAFAYWHEQGLQVALYELEDTLEDHVIRSLAQRDGNGELTYPTWIEEHPEEARAAHARHAAFMDTFGPRLHCTDDKGQLTHEDLAEWVEKQCAEGCDLIGIDPVTAAASNKEPWAADLKFIMRLKSAVRAAGSRLILVTHPRKGHGTQMGMDDISGGAAYSRFAHNAAWLETVDEPDMQTMELTTWQAGVPFTATERVNRVLRIIKGRACRRKNACVGLWFDGGNLRLQERGFVTSRPKPKRH